MTVTELAGNTKIAVTTSAITTTTGAATALDALGAYLGPIATAVGIVLSVVLIITHWRNGLAEYRKTKMETKLLREQVESMRAKTSTQQDS